MVYLFICLWYSSIWIWSVSCCEEEFQHHQDITVTWEEVLSSRLWLWNGVD